MLLAGICCLNLPELVLQRNNYIGIREYIIFSSISKNKSDNKLQSNHRCMCDMGSKGDYKQTTRKVNYGKQTLPIY